MNLSPERHRRAHPEREIGGRAAGRLTCLERAENESMAALRQARPPQGHFTRPRKQIHNFCRRRRKPRRARACVASDAKSDAAWVGRVGCKQASESERGRGAPSDRQTERATAALPCGLSTPLSIPHSISIPQSTISLSLRPRRERGN